MARKIRPDNPIGDRGGLVLRRARSHKQVACDLLKTVG